MFSNKELLQMQVNLFQERVPDTVSERGKIRPITKLERLACGRAIWYIIMLGWGLSTSTTKASTQFRCRHHQIEKVVRKLFPEDYFSKLERQKNNLMKKKLMY